MGLISHFFTIFFALWFGFVLFEKVELVGETVPFSLRYTFVILIFSAGLIVSLQFIFIQCRSEPLFKHRLKYYFLPFLYAVIVVLAIYFIQREWSGIIPLRNPTETSKLILIVPLVTVWLIVYEVYRYAICGRSLCNILRE